MQLDEVKADEHLERLPPVVVANIINGLSQDGAWEKVVQFLRTKNLISEECQRSMRNSSSPEEEFFNSCLVHRCRLRVKVFQEILKNCQLYHILRTINTGDPAEILSPKKDTTHVVPLGATVKLPVDVRGSPFPLIQWCFNGQPLLGKTSHELVLETFSVNNIGEYTYIVTQHHNGNVTKLTSHKYILDAEDTCPTISLDLEDVEIEARENLILSFKAAGYPEPKCFTWFKNKNHIATTDLPELIIRNADVLSSGEYCCKVSNKAGFCFTRKALVKIEEPVMCPERPEIIQQPSTNEEYYVGDWMYLQCEVVCRQKVGFTCFLNDKEIQGSSNARVAVSSSSKNHYLCELKYRLTKEEKDREKLKQLTFKFEVISASDKMLTKDVKVEVKTREVEVILTARNKWALLIGNSNYQQMEELPATRNDINVLKENFRALGFRVFILNNLTRNDLQNAVRQFSAFVQEEDYVAFYYGGHGIHNDGKDYIIPTDASIKFVSRGQNVCHDKVKDISLDECISYVWITNVLQRTKPALIFSVYDTCRGMKPEVGESRSHSSRDFQTALKNSFFIFATSENYGAFEGDVDTSLLVNTLQRLMVSKLSVQELSIEVLKTFQCPDEYKERQVPKICGDLALPRSLSDHSRPLESDESDTGVLKEWEELASVGGEIQDTIHMEDIKVKASMFWTTEPRWVVSNFLPMTLKLAQDAKSQEQEIDVQIKLWDGMKYLQESQKMRGELSCPFTIFHLQDLKATLWIELCLTCKGHQYQKTLHLESPAISQKFFRGNYID